jgi:hypothetical protein
VFGLVFKGTPIDVMSLTCEVLKLLDFVRNASLYSFIGVADNPERP